MERHFSLLYHRVASCKTKGELYSRRNMFARSGLKFKWHIHLQNVPGRDFILSIPNDARKELLGCIAPVTKHTGIGKGSAPE
jgi:hypothetical protein